MPPSVLWFRRDLRLDDQPALLAARDAGDVLALFVLDDVLWSASGPNRRAFLAAALTGLRERLDGRLAIVAGRPAEVVPRVAREVGASSVHVSADYGPYGSRRDQEVANALQHHDIELVGTGSPYAVAPGRVRKDDGTPFRVFTPFSRAWRRHGWRAPAPAAPTAGWISYDGESHDIPVVHGSQARLPEATEAAARRRWSAFRDGGLADYAERRDDPGGDHTSRLSPYLKWGLIHPRTLLADLDPMTGPGPDAFTNELCWREFYADVLHHRPDSARGNYQEKFDRMRWQTGALADEHFAAWQRGRTGYPFVDAAMRQLSTEGWMHNRARMVVASFLVKDLHLDWRRGAAHFLHHLVDGDLASNQHGWQWTAGSGTDAAPFFRIFNPIEQGKRWDPDGAYVRRFVPELNHLQSKEIHEPWDSPGGLPAGYPDRIVDHRTERQEALDRYAETKG